MIAQSIEVIGRYIPEGSEPVSHEGSDAIVYLYTRADSFIAIGYEGKKRKSSFHYTYRTESSRSTFVEAFLDKAEATEKQKRLRKAEQQNATHDFAVGAIFYNTWGYEQTNVNWYEVIRVPSNKTIVIREIGKEKTYTGSMIGNSLPLPGTFVGDPLIKRINGAGYFPMKHGSLNAWDGRPQSFSEYA